MESVAPAASLHDTSRLFVHNLHLSVKHDIFLVDAEHGVGFEELEDGVNAFRLDGIVLKQGILFRDFFLVGEVGGFELGEFGGDVGKHEERIVLHLVCEPFVTLVGEIDAVHFLVHDEVERLDRLGHSAVVVLHVDFLGLEHARLDSCFGEELDERVVLGQRLVAAEELEETLFFFFFVAGGYELFGFCEELCGEFALHFDEFFDEGLILLKELVVAFGHGTGDDERRSGVVNKHGVHLIDDGVVVATLHEVFGAHRHVVAQVVETELVVRSEGDVSLIGAAAGVGVGLMFVDAIDGETVEHVERSHPLGVTLGKIVVDGDDVHAVSGERVEEDGKGGDEGFSFTRCHFRNLSLGEDDAAEELHVIVNHVPLHVVAAGNPVVEIDGFVAFDADEVVGSGEFAVEVVGGDFDGFVLGEAGCGFSDDGIDLGEHLGEGVLHAVEHLRFEFVDLVEDDFAVFNGCLFNLRFESFDFLFQVVCRGLHFCSEFLSFGTQGVVVQRFDGGRRRLDFFDPRLNEFHVARGFVAEKFAEYFVNVHEE